MSLGGPSPPSEQQLGSVEDTGSIGESGPILQSEPLASLSRTHFVLAARRNQGPCGPNRRAIGTRSAGGGAARGRGGRRSGGRGGAARGWDGGAASGGTGPLQQP